VTADSILAAAATVIAALLGLIGVLLGKILGNTRRLVEHVANSHVDENGNPINMRDDLDEKFEGLADLVKGVAADQGGMKEDLRLIRRDQSTDRATAAQAAREAAKAVRIAQAALKTLKPKRPTQQGES
jgi:peptidoglycan hydrolase CwlO-like protein